jgi:hypothetical protein
VIVTNSNWPSAASILLVWKSGYQVTSTYKPGWSVALTTVAWFGLRAGMPTGPPMIG